MSLYGGVYDDLASAPVVVKEILPEETPPPKPVPYKSTLHLMAPKIRKKKIIATKKRSQLSNEVSAILFKPIVPANTVQSNDSFTSEFYLPPDIDIYDPYRPNNYEDFLIQKEKFIEESKKKKIQETIEKTIKQSEIKIKEKEINSEVIPNHQVSEKAKVMMNETAEEALERRILMGKKNMGLSLKSKEISDEQVKLDLPLVSKSTICTPVLLLENMVSPGEIDSELQPEICEECSRFGKVNSCIIYEIPTNSSNTDKAVRVFVQFNDIESCKRAFLSLNGRFFDGKKVRASFYNVEKFKNNDFAPAHS